MIHISLTTHPRAGRIFVDGQTFDLATWHKAGDGLMLATTTDGQRVTLATRDDDGAVSGSLCIGNHVDAPRWNLIRCRRDGAELRGEAMLAPSDAWLTGYLERLGRRVRG